MSTASTQYDGLTDAERDHAIEIDVTRMEARRHLGRLVTETAEVHRYAERLMSNAVYDVEVAEGTAARVIPAALAQIEVALAALDAALPHPGQ